MKKTTWREVVVGITIVVILIIGICNMICYNKFWETSVSSIITLLIAVVFSYYFTQSKNDIRKKKEKADRLLYKIQDIILEKGFIESDPEEISRVNLIKHRSLANKIECLKKTCKGDDEIYKDIEKLEEEFSRFREFYGEHYKDSEYMLKSQNELQNYVTKMDDIADQIHIKIM